MKKFLTLLLLSLSVCVLQAAPSALTATPFGKQLLKTATPQDAGSLLLSSPVAGNGSGFTNLNLSGAFLQAGAPAAYAAVAETYCQRAQIVSPAARQFVHNFVYGLYTNGLGTNIVDFAFFRRGLNVPFGPPMSLLCTGAVYGSINRLMGGYEIPSVVPNTNNSFIFTNLPPTPNGRTLIVWCAGNLNTCGVVQDQNLKAMQFASGPGNASTVMSLYSGGSGYVGYLYNTLVQDIGSTQLMPVSGNYGPVECVAFSSGPAQNSEFLSAQDYWGAGTSGTGHVWNNHMADYTVTDVCGTSPTFVSFGKDYQTGNSGWNGLVGGYLLLNLTITNTPLYDATNQLLAINALFPRVGLLVGGDSKSTDGSGDAANVAWDAWWQNAPGAWGLLSVRTNSAIGGTLMSTASGGANSIQARSIIDLNNFKSPTAQFPVNIYAIRGGHNDFLGAAAATTASISNCWVAMTNTWQAVRTNGYKVMAWTVDRTSITWSGGSPGNSNLLNQLDGQIRAYSTNVDYLFDNEKWYVGNFGETPFNNASIYEVAGVHDNVSTWFLGTNGAATTAVVSLGYEQPPQSGFRVNDTFTGLHYGDGSGLTNINTALTTNAIPANVLTAGRAYYTNAAGDIGLASFAGVPNNTTWGLELWWTNSAAAQHVMSFPGGVGGSYNNTNLAGKFILAAGKWAKLRFSGYGQLNTNVAVEPNL